MTCQAFLFDMDGVLFDTELYFMQLLIQGVQDRYNISDVMGHEHLFRLMAGKTSFQMLDVCCEQLNVPPLSEAERRNLCEKVDQNISSSVDLGEIPMKPGLLQFLTYLKAHHHPTAVCSNASSEAVQNFLSGAGIDEFFTLVLSAQMVEEPKPSPCIYLTAMRKLNVEASQTLIFEDSKTGLTAALASGAHVCMLNQFYNEGLYPELTRINNFENWDDLLREKYGLSIN